MPASLVTEEALAGALIKKENYTATVAWLGLSTKKPSEVEKKTTAKAFGEAEPTAGNGWVRKQVDTAEWELTKAEGESGATKYKNKNAIVWTPPVTAGEYKLETVAILTKQLASEDEASSKGILLFGKLTTPVTINSATTKLEFAAKELTVEVE